jgi:tetratricopeptide (TPR) repeat protein
VGSKLAILAAAQLSVVGIAAAQAPTSDEYKKAIEAYKAGKYDEAANLLEKAYKVEPKPEILFALAQAERLGGHCDKALVHYKQLLTQTTELATAKAVQNNLVLCPGGEAPKTEPKSDPKSEPRIDVVQGQTKTVVVRKSDPLAIGLLAGGALSGGFAIGMLLRSSSTRDDAATARTLDDANELHDRADRDRLVAIVAGGVGAVAIGYAVFRLTRGGKPATTEVAVTPTSGGSMVVLSKIW